VHELSLCGAIADIARRRAGDRRVDVIHVRIGRLRQVIPDTLVFCWSLVTSGSELDGSVLEVERIDARLRCRACGEEHAFGEDLVFACPGCHGLDVEVVAGEEFDVTALELVEV
jgi:hydrogenase nickel incorporation protein HypA/HybF